MTTEAPSGAETEILDGLLTEAELCRVVKRSPQTLRIWRKRRGLPFVIIPGEGRNAIRYRRADVEPWIEKSKGEPWATRNGLVLRARWSLLRRRVA